MYRKMTPEEFEAYVRSLPDNEQGDYVLDRNVPVQQPVFQERPPVNAETERLMRMKETLEDEIFELDMDEPMEGFFDSYDEFEMAYSDWEDEMEELKERLTELEEQIKKAGY